MIVRDLTKPKADYKGHPCYASDAECPCRPCYNCHDCSPPDRRYSNKVYSDTFECAVRHNNGCPQPKLEPVHTLNRLERCIRCGTTVRKV